MSIPYLILAFSACIATAMVHYAPDGTESMYDTVAEADEALDSARSCGSRHSSRDGTRPERRPLVSPPATPPAADGQGSGRGKVTVGSLYRLKA